jgi:hypothetical protein
MTLLNHCRNNQALKAAIKQLKIRPADQWWLLVRKA